MHACMPAHTFPAPAPASYVTLVCASPPCPPAAPACPHPIPPCRSVSVVRTYCGHGIGDLFHCAPNVPHYAKNKARGTMKVGEVFTIGGWAGV